jgi:sec-independent protein translocase protein TatB
MNFLGIGTGELLLILLIVLLVVGPERLPQLARQWARFAKTLSQFTRTWQQFNAELSRQLSLEEADSQKPKPAPKPAPAPPPAVPEPDDNAIAPPELAQLDAASQPMIGPAEAAGEATRAADQAPHVAAANPAEEIQHEQ